MHLSGHNHNHNNHHHNNSDDITKICYNLTSFQGRVCDPIKEAFHGFEAYRTCCQCCQTQCGSAMPNTTDTNTTQQHTSAQPHQHMHITQAERSQRTPSASLS